MEKKDFYEFIERLKCVDDWDYFKKIVISHLLQAPIQHRLNVNSYFPGQTHDRLKFISALKEIDVFEELPPNRRIVFEQNTFENMVFYVDSKVVFKYKISE